MRATRSRQVRTKQLSLFAVSNCDVNSAADLWLRACVAGGARARAPAPDPLQSRSRTANSHNGSRNCNSYNWNQNVWGDVPERPCAVPAETIWPSGLRRWLKAPVRKGVGSRTPQLSRLQSAPRRAEAEPASSFRCRGKADLGDWPDQQQTACANTCAATRQGCIGNWHVETAGPRNHTP